MTAPLIHPENLLEKFAEGALTPNEHNLLQEHLADCVACRFELVVRADLETEAETLEFDHISTRELLLTLPPSQLTAAQSAAGQLTAGQLGPPVGEPHPIAPISVRRRRPWRRTLAITAAAVGLASGAAALVATQAPSTPRTLDVSARPADPVGRAAVRQKAPKSAPLAEPDATAPAPATAPAEPRASQSTRQRSTMPASRAATSLVEADETLTAAQLFSEANQARRASDAARATMLYRLLQRKYPSSQEAQLSLVTLGSLQLNGGNAAAALATFNRYLNRGGRSLEAEALYGQAQALRRLGRTDEERRAWERLLARYPGSGYAPQARERLGSLGGS